MVVGLAALAGGVYLAVRQRGNSESRLLLEEKIRELQEKERQIHLLESEVAKAREALTEQSGQLAGLKTKLEDTQKELASVRVRLGVATREVERMASSRPQSVAQPPSRPPDPSPRPAPSPVNQGARTGLYETIRPTSVYEDPTSSSRVLSQIPPGTRVNVVRTLGDWLEVRSKVGNPPGYIRAGDARFLYPAN